MENLTQDRPIALLAGFDAVTAEVCRRRLEGEVRVLMAGSEEEVLQILAERPVAALCLGAGFPEGSALDLLEKAAEVSGAEAADQRVNLVLAGGPDLSAFQDWIDQDRLFYLTAEPIPADDVAALLRSALERRRSGFPRPSRERRLAAAVGSVATAATPAGAARALASAATELIEADRGTCLFHDPARDLLWIGEDGDPDARRESAAVGLVSFVARTGLPIALERIGRDPRFDREADDPPAEGDERFAALPVRVAAGEPVLAVLSVVRPAHAPAFSPDELGLLRRLAEQAAPLLARLLPGLEEAASAGAAQVLFREQALKIHQAGMRIEGDLLRADPGWMQWTYRLLLAVLVVTLLFSVLGRVREYASGPAVVRLGGRTDLRATASGTVSEVLAAHGEPIAAGQVLVRLHGAQEAAELARIEREIELQLINRLRDPSDTAAERSLLSLRAERELARSRVAERELRAPAAGAVEDVRVRPGQPVAPGQVLVTLGGPDGERTVIALLPGEYRPQLKPGMELRMELQGYRYAYQNLTVADVGSEVVGPAEARRYLGDEIADAATLGGAVVLVTARLPSLTFEAEGRTRRYHDGMWGKAEVKVRSEPILVALIPALKALFENRS